MAESNPVVADVDDDDASSDSGSVSFVITDDIDKEMISYMTQSQYSQVVFQDIADRYPNNQDLLCLYTLTGDLESSENDRIGIFRVPSFAPHDYITFKWVHHESPLDAKKKSLNIIFEASVLPKDEDFYQFQYLRGDQVFGASVPFHFRGGEELCAVEDDEFLRIDRETDLAHRNMIDKVGSLTNENEELKAKLTETESKATELSSEFEKLKSELANKEESFFTLDEQFKSHQETSTKEIEQLKLDFSFALQDKLVLEERLHKGQKLIKELQTERDLLSGKVNQMDNERKLLAEERVVLLARLDEDKNMFMATSKAKDMAVSEIKNYIVRNDELQRRMDLLQRNFDACQLENENLKLILDSLKSKLEAAEAGKDQAEKDKDLIIADLESKLDSSNDRADKLEAELALKTKEFEVLSAELVNRSKSKFKEIDSLKKQLSEAERALNQHMKGAVSGSGDQSLGSVLESLSQLEIADGNAESDHDQSNLRKLEDRIRVLHSEFKQLEQTHADEIRSIKDELESIRSTAMTQSYTSSLASNDSRKLLDSQIISERMPMVAAVGLPMPLPPPKRASSRTQTFSRQESIASQTESVSSRDSHTMTSTASASKHLMEEPLPAAPAMSAPVEPGQSLLSYILPNLSVNVCQNNRTTVTSEPSPRQPLIPERASGHPDNRPEPKETSVEDELSALAAWARGSIMATLNRGSSVPKQQEEPVAAPLNQDNDVADVEAPPVVVADAAGAARPDSDSVVVLTDDGRTFEAPKENLACPFCNKEYQPTEAQKLQLHVEVHMERSQSCPVCSMVFEFTDGSRRAFEAHVQGHFPEESGDFVELGNDRQPQPQQQQQQPQQQQPQQQQQQQRDHRDRFWFLDFD